MIRTMKKRLCPLLMLLCILSVSLNSSLLAVYANGSSETANYTAFGDSIAAGFGLAGYSAEQAVAPSDSYQALLGDFLHTQSHNYAVTGDNSSHCIALLLSGKADVDLKDADVITLSIGSNDLLLPFIQIVMDFFDLPPGTFDESTFTNGFTMSQLDISELLKYRQQLPELVAELTDNATLHAQATAFPEKFQEILSILHDKAPSAEIYVTNIYNPFAFVPVINNLADTYIQEINQAFSADADDYTLIDVYTPFNNEALTNIHIDMTNLANSIPDPHPSVQGHKVIGDLLITALKNTHTPKAATLHALSTNQKTKLTAKIKLPANADGYQIRYAASKTGTYKTLASGSDKTFRSNSKKLKSGKTYFIKVRSYKTVNGITYYGKNSNVKKITIK